MRDLRDPRYERSVRSKNWEIQDLRDRDLLRDQEIGIMADRHNSERLILTFVIPAFQFLRGIILCLQIMEFFADCLY